ncbi:MAG: RDD family protein [Chloroflexi bacterium]|nr:RDD family protein [Chloroflexota bacterium]
MMEPAREQDASGEAPEVTTADLAGFWIRLAAFVIDMAIIAGGSWVVSFTIGQAMGVADPFQFPPVIRKSFLGVIGIAGGFYFPWLWKQTGQTLGNRALGIRVVRTRFYGLGWTCCLLRFLGYLVCWALLGIPFALVGFDRKKQGLHDKMADTYVIMLPKKKVRVARPHAHAVEHA